MIQCFLFPGSKKKKKNKGSEEDCETEREENESDSFTYSKCFIGQMFQMCIKSSDFAV